MGKGGRGVGVYRLELHQVKNERPVILIDGGRDAWVYLWVKIAFMSVKLGKKRKVTISKGQER